MAERSRTKLSIGSENGDKREVWRGVHPNTETEACTNTVYSLRSVRAWIVKRWGHVDPMVMATVVATVVAGKKQRYNIDVKRSRRRVPQYV